MADTNEQINAPAAPEVSTPSTPPQASTPPAAGAPVATEAAKPESRRDTITRALADKKAESGDTGLRDRLIAEGKIKPASAAKQAAAAARARAENGQFAGGVKAAAQAASGTPNAGEPAAPQKPPLPKWLKKELAPVWEQGQPELLQAFLQYGEDATKGIDKYKTAAQERDALLAEFRPYDNMLRGEGATPQSVIRNLMQTAAQLRQGSPQDKAQLVARTMQQFGIPFEHIAGLYGIRLTDANGQPINSNVQQQDPHIAAVLARVQQLEGSIQSQQQAAQAHEDARIAKIAESFGKDRPHYEQLKPQIAGILNGGLVDGADTMSESEILNAAYDMALRLNPTLYEQHLREERERAAQGERDKANQAAQASRAAAVQVRGAPGGPSLPAVDPKDRRSAIRAAIAAHSR